MALNKVLTWLVSDSGKKFCYFAAGTASTGILFANVLPHTIFLDEYQNFIRLYKNGFAVNLPQKIQERFQKTLDLLEIEEKDKHLFKPFAAYGFDIFSAGYSLSKYGVKVGIPANFLYENVASVDKHMIKIRDDPVLWETDEGQLLLKSLVLSEEAQMYAMAREIKFRETPKLPLDTTVSVLSFISMYGVSRRVNTKWNLYVKPLGVRLILYGLVSLFSFGNYALCKDFSQTYYEEQIDKYLKEKNKIFAEGGKEFYSKILDRNRALRKLLGREGEKIYSTLGNENYFMRHKHLPLVHRKSLFEQPV